jgi:hypothetical protein
MKIQLECFPTGLAVVSQLLTTENEAKFQDNLRADVEQYSSIRRTHIQVIHSPTVLLPRTLSRR